MTQRTTAIPTARRAEQLEHQGVSHSEIARRLGVSKQRIHRILRGYKSPNGCPGHVRGLLLLLLTADTRLTYKKIAELMGVPPGTVGVWAAALRREGVFSGRHKVATDAPRDC